MSQPLQPGPQAIIASGASLSGALDLKEFGLAAIQMPADWTTAAITFVASSDPDGTYYPVHIAAGTEVSITTADDRYVILDPTIFSGIRYLKIRSGTTATPVNQAAARTLFTMVRCVP